MKSAGVGFTFLPALILLLTLSLSYGTPSRYNLFQGSAYSGSVSRQRNKNWCAYVVQKNVSCAVLDTRAVEFGSAPCPVHEPGCAQGLLYQSRPMYKVGYKLVTELEWRCCPGYRGHDCMELKDAPPPPHDVQEPYLNPPPIHTQQSGLGPEIVSGARPWSSSGQGGQTRHPWTEGGESGRHGGYQDYSRVQELDEEVQRLSQTVLDLQAAMTTANANLRLNLQEDASRIVMNLLSNMRQPQGALTGGTESIVLPSDPLADELQNQVTHLSNTISTNSNTIQDLEARLLQLEGQVNRLTEVTSETTPPLPSSKPETVCPCQAYIDKKLQSLREELLEGMDIKMADLKNACDYKMMSVKEQCEEQESSYLSLAELLDSKEADLRQEIQDLRRLVSAGAPSGSEVPDLQTEIHVLKEEHQILANAMNVTTIQQKAWEKALEAKVSLAERSAEVHCHSLEEKLRKEMAKEKDAQNRALESKISAALQVLGGRQSQAIATDNTGSQYITGLQKNMENLQSEVGSLIQQVKHLENTAAVLSDSVSNRSNVDGLTNRLDKLEQDCGRTQELVSRLEGVCSSVDKRVGIVESLCGRLEPMSDSLNRIKDGLNRHVNGLWNCVRQLNNTVLTHFADLNTLRTSTHPTVGRQNGTTGTPPYTTGVRAGMEDSSVPLQTGSALPSPPVLMSGEAGPPGTKLSSRPPQGANGSMTPVKGYAAAPGYPPQAPVSLTPHTPSGPKSLGAPVSFSAGLTLLPYSGEISIIRFNKVLLNDGGHYDPHTGVFSVPLDGRYLLTVVLTAAAGKRVEAVLSVANRSIQKLDTSGSGGVTSAGCLCGGSASASLVLDLQQGQKVGVVMTSGTLAISASTEVLSTFSGVLLHPVAGKR